MAATLKDVALKAGVSIKTVSNVVNGYAHVTPEMRQRVQAAIEELNYQPNLPARYLRKGRLGVLAFAIPDLRNSYFSDIGNVIVEAAAAHDYTVFIDHTQGEHDNECLVINGLRPRLIDGVIVSPLSLQSGDIRPQELPFPLVLLGEHFLDVPYDYISFDNVAAARMATEHLLSLGRRRIAAIGAQEALPFETGRLRLRGYKEALAAAGHGLDSQLIVQIERYNRELGARGMRQLLELSERPDAVFCFNDLMALGAMRALYEAGLRVPEDVAVMGFDDIEDTRFSTPSLSTVVTDKERIGKLAVDFLVGRIKGTRTGAAERVMVPFQLVPRESTLGRRTS